MRWAVMLGTGHQALLTVYSSLKCFQHTPQICIFIYKFYSWIVVNLYSKYHQSFFFFFFKTKVIRNRILSRLSVCTLGPTGTGCKWRDERCTGRQESDHGQPSPGTWTHILRPTGKCSVRRSLDENRISERVPGQGQHGAGAAWVLGETS